MTLTNRLHQFWQALCQPVSLHNRQSQDPPSADSLESCPASGWYTLQDRHQQPVGVLIHHSAADSQKTIDRLQQQGLESASSSYRARLSTIIGDQLAQASSLIASALSNGQVMRVVGPPELLAGLHSGTMSLVDSNGKLGLVRVLPQGDLPVTYNLLKPQPCPSWPQ